MEPSLLHSQECSALSSIIKSIIIHPFLPKSLTALPNELDLQVTSSPTILEVKAISKQNIKPSTLTPPDLKTFQLSGIDQTSPPVPVSLVFFYSAKDVEENEIRISHLKQSLSEVLSRFYPLVGRIDGNDTIDCTDEGINFFEAQVKAQLREVINNPEADQLRQLLPSDDFFAPGPKMLASIQANIFECGGIAIGVSVSHKAMDASSISVFLKHWAAQTRGHGGDMVDVKLEMASIFPPRYVNVAAYPPGKAANKLVTKRFIFSSSNIAALRERCSSAEYIKSPSRVEAVSALIWRCATNAAREKTGSVTKKTVANVIVNMRGRVEPALSEDYVGNSVLGTMTESEMDSYTELDALAAQLRAAIRKVDSDYVKNVQTDEGFYDFIDSYKQIEEPFSKSELEMYTITSWMRFPFYEVDFGWGAPTWACSAGLPGKNIIALMDSKSGDGVEAWVALDEDDMSIFEREPELLSFTSTSQTA